MSAIFQPEQQNGSSKEQRDDLCDLLIQACPEVPTITSETANRIFDNALREASLSNIEQSRLRSIAGTRLALSAALCICAAAGMLLLRSKASEWSEPNRAVQQSVAAPARQRMAALVDLSGEPKLTKRLPDRLHKQLSPILTRSHVVSSGLSRRDFDRATEYEGPPMPVCGMATFSIFTPSPASSVSPVNRSSTNDSDEGSLIVWVVSDDGSSEAGGSGQNPGGGVDADLNGSLKQLSNVLLVSVDSDAMAFSERFRPINCVVPVLVTTELSAWSKETPVPGNEIFTSVGASNTLDLLPPNYKAF